MIATWSGNRRVKNPNYLKNHILKLLSLKQNLSQITIVKPLIGGDDSYYDFGDLLNNFNTKIVILERQSNEGHSYGQLFYAYETYKDEFDYYIFVEDDYQPNIDNFDSLLLDIYEEKNYEGYLCSFSGFNDDYPNGGCSISNGLISTNQLKLIYEKTPNPSLVIDSKFGDECHKNFTDLLISCGLKFNDFASKYRVPYFGNSVIEYGRVDTDESIFVPHQLFNLDIKFRKMDINDIPTFLVIRNLSKDFLHNNSTFTLDQANNWFIKTNPIFFIIQLGESIIGYFRTSNWVDKSMYVGCDLHPDFRGYGLGYLSYLKFIDMIYNKFDIDIIKLEVLSTNNRAKNLYNKLGFKEIGISDEKIVRNEVQIESIIMELKK